MTEEDKKERRAPARQRIAGRYEVLGRLGSGPHGPTYRARDHRLQDDGERTVALKILRTERANAQGFDEALAALVRHLADVDESIVAPRDAGRTELGLPYLSFELIEGENLEDVLTREGALDPRLAHAIVRRLAEGLEQVHEGGLVHGGIDLHRVLLVGTGEGRQPRLLDVGLDALLTRGSLEPDEDAYSADVRALGRLYAALLSADPTGKTLPAGLGTETRTLIEDALTEDGFQEMRSLRAALTDPAPDPVAVAHVPQAIPVGPGPSRWPYLLLAVTLALTAGAAAWIARGRVSAAGFDPRLDQEHSRLARELEEESERAAGLQRSLEETRAELQGRSAEPALDEERERLTETVEELSGALEAERERTQAIAAAKAQAESARAALEQQQLEQRRRLEALEQENREARVALAQQEAEARAREAAQDERMLMAQGLEQRLRAGDPRGVWSYLEPLVQAGDLEAALADAPFLAAWTEADDRLKRSEEVGSEAIGDLVEQARAAIERARAQKERFVASLRRSLGQRSELEGAIDQSLVDLEHRVEARLAARDAAREWDWRGVLDLPLEADPTTALRMARTFADADERHDALFRSVARSLSANYQIEGLLQLDALTRGPDLAPWARALAAAELETEGADTIASYAWAQLWYTSAAPLEAFASWHRPSAQRSDALDRWSAGLAVELALLDPSGAFPGPPGQRALYRTTPVDGPIRWQIETVLVDEAPPEGVLHSWIVQQRFYDAEGRYKSERSVRRMQRDRSLFEEGVRDRRIFRGALWNDGPRRLTKWSPPDDAPPFRLPIDPTAIEAFQERLSREPVRALVVPEDGDAWSLWSPTWGLLRHEDPSLAKRELLFAD